MNYFERNWFTTVYYATLLMIFTCSPKLFSDSDSGQNARIIVSSPISLMDEELLIEIEGLQPFQKAKIQTEMVDDNGERWNSWALFQADKNGLISISKQTPLSGTYQQADGMGLFWSMHPSRH